MMDECGLSLARLNMKCEYNKSFELVCCMLYLCGVLIRYFECDKIYKFKVKGCVVYQLYTFSTRRDAF